MELPEIQNLSGYFPLEWAPSHVRSLYIVGLHIYGLCYPEITEISYFGLQTKFRVWGLRVLFVMIKQNEVEFQFAKVDFE